jgi:hypothetical protein
MVDPHVEVALRLCTGCHTPVLEVTEVGGAADGHTVAAHLTKEGVVQLGANMLRLARIAGLDQQLIQRERGMVGWGFGK